MKILGLIGGVSWVSAIDYYRYINEGINEELGGLNFSECIMYSVNFAEWQTNISNNNWEANFQLVLKTGTSLKKAGAEGIVLCCNTMHLFADRVEEALQLPLVNIVTATATAIQNNGLNKAGLLGTKFTMEMDFFKKGLVKQNIEWVIPREEAVRNYIQHTLKEELGRGIVREETKQQYLAIINNMIEAGAQCIILGCTELPLIIKPNDVAVPVFDTVKIHARAAVKFSLG
jgi:aspartate racemase